MMVVYYRTLAAFQRDPLPSADPVGGIDKNDYKCVAPIEGTHTFGEVFRMMNAVDGDELCCKLGVRSMSVGDIIVDEDGDVWFCAMTGWEQVQW